MATRRFHTPKIAGSIPALATSLCVALLLYACAQQPVRQLPAGLPVAARPALKPISADAFKCPVKLPSPYTMCMTDATYTTLVDRERALKTWGLQLEAIIQANNQHADHH